MGVILKNNAVSTITTALSASDVGLAVAAGTGSLFPTLGAGDYFYATLVSSGGTYEVIKVTARVNDTMTIVRAQEGTTAQSFASGSRLEARVTAASITDMLDYHDQASEISFSPTGTISSTDVQSAIAEVSGDVTAAAAALAASSGSSLVGHIASGTGAVARSAQDKMRDVVYVEDFGAVGDGVVDDTTKIQAALDAVVASGATLFFRNLEYLTGKLALNGDVNMAGPGTLKLRNSINDHLLYNNTGGAITLNIRDMTFDGNYANQTAWTAMLSFTEVDTITFIGCTVRNIYGAGFEITDLNDRVTIQNCLFEGNRDHSGTLNENPIFVSIRGTPSSDTQIVTITDNVFIGEVPTLSKRGAGGVAITNNSGGTNTQGPKCTITGNTFYTIGQDVAGNRLGAITLYRASPYSSICNNRILTSYENGIDIQGSFAPIVTGNYIENASSLAIAFAPRDTPAVNCASGIIQGNVIEGTAAIGIGVYGGPPVPTSDSDHVVIANNIVRNVSRFLYVTDYLGSVSITGNIFEASTSTATGDESSVAIIGSRTTGTQSVDARILFSDNLVNDFQSFIYIAEWALPITVSNNTISNGVKEPALFLLFNTSSVNVVGNNFKDCEGFVTIQYCDLGANVSANTFENSMGTIRGLTFKDLPSGSLTVTNGNVFKDCDDNIINYDAALGRNLCVNNISDAGKSIRVVVPSAVTQANNLFV